VFIFFWSGVVSVGECSCDILTRDGVWVRIVCGLY